MALPGRGAVLRPGHNPRLLPNSAVRRGPSSHLTTHAAAAPRHRADGSRPGPVFSEVLAPGSHTDIRAAD